MGKLRSLVGITRNKLFYLRHSMSTNDIVLRCIKQKYSGERCFLIGGGPSMKKIDMSKLKNEYTAGLNLVFLSGIVTNFTFICGYKILQKHKEEVAKLPNLFLGCSAGRYYLSNKKSFREYSSIVVKDYGEISVWNDISFDMLKGARGGDSVSFFALQVLLYMGFKEIYLLGHDCDYSGEQYFYKNISSQTTERPWDKIFKNYEITKEYFEKKDAKIYNATPGGKLEVFERVNLEDVL